jgi:hypothetical protein
VITHGYMWFRVRVLLNLLEDDVVQIARSYTSSSLRQT